MKYFSKIIIVILSFVINYSCSSSAIKSPSPKPRGIWDKLSNTYKDQGRNLQWDLSNIDNWRLADDARLPENAMFCAASDQFGICIALIAIPMDSDDKLSSAWDAPQAFIDGMVDSFEKQAPIFPGIRYGEPYLEKVMFMFKKALKISLNSEISDARLMTTDAVPFAIQGYVFVKDNEIIEIIALVPQYIIDEFGDEPFDDLLLRLSYIDATKEVK